MCGITTFKSLCLAKKAENGKGVVRLSQSFVEGKSSTGKSSNESSNIQPQEWKRNKDMNTETQHPLVYTTIFQSRNILDIYQYFSKYKVQTMRESREPYTGLVLMFI